MPENQPTAGETSNDRVPIAIVDTNVLMRSPRLYEWDWGEPEVHIYILDTVVDELRGLARERVDMEKARKAQRARDILDNLQKKCTPQGLPFQEGRVRLFFVPPPANIQPPLSADNVDHQQIALAKECMRKDADRFCAIITLDGDMIENASASNLPLQTIKPAGARIEDKVGQLFHTRHEYYNNWRIDQKGTRPAPAEPARKDGEAAKKRHLDADERLRRTVQNFYSRVRAARHRAILSISPLKARIALTGHIVSVLKSMPNRVLMIYVDSASAADYWAAELRVCCKLASKAIHVFHDQGLPVGDDSRVIIYRHDQIESRFKQHVARLEESNRQITIIVDGCDLLRPEQLALLLFEKHQFIGYTRHVLNHAQARGGHMLAHFFELQSILTYTFVDAEEDGWLRSFDLIRHPVAWLPHELEEYAEKNTKYLEEHSHVLKTYPILARCYDFWDGLQELLETVADARTANLFQLQERREEMAQMAGNKLDVLFELVRGDAPENKHQIIFDPCGLWAAILLKKYIAGGKKAELVGNAITLDEWARLWQQFIHNQVEILILTEVPPFDLCRADIQRLVITTPIASLSGLAAMMDWVLSHTHPEGKHPVEIHTLYVLDTPEEAAMLGFADSVCGVHFS